MAEMTMRDRILAVVRGEEMDRVPFVMYEGIMPRRTARAILGAGPDGGSRIGVMRWSRVHRVDTPHCRIDAEDYMVGDTHWRRNILHTPAGDLVEERAFEPTYSSSSIRKHYVEEAADYPALWAYLEDGVIREDYAQFHKDAADLGEDGTPLVAIERTPYQQLWVQWVGLGTLGYHIADYPDLVMRTVEILDRRAREIMEIAARSPAEFIDFPDNITAPAIGPRRFAEYCVPYYNALADMLAERGGVVFVHTDGDLRPLWGLLAASKVGGLDSLAPAPDNDTSVADAARLFPEKRLFVNFPSSQHLLPAEGVRAVADEILAAAGHTGRLQIQLSENVPPTTWRTSLPAIAEAVEAFGRP
ncbi:MAG: hypothetical protein GX649_14690 [Chloroflexi bacterium]|nr:hypothetical protein [Chloroflexota bacterium]